MNICEVVEGHVGQCQVKPPQLQPCSCRSLAGGAGWAGDCCRWRCRSCPASGSWDVLTGWLQALAGQLPEHAAQLAVGTAGELALEGGDHACRGVRGGGSATEPRLHLGTRWHKATS